MQTNTTQASETPMPVLLGLWKDLGDIPVNHDGQILESFQAFPAGTHREEIWQWFESQNPEFLIGDIMCGKVWNSRS